MSGLDRKAILEAVHRLPTDEQWQLASEIMRTAPRREPPAAPSLQRGTATSLRGIARTGEPLDDERMLDESRKERFE